jgi:hypothetical protein
MAKRRVSKSQVTLYQEEQSKVKAKFEGLAQSYLSKATSLSGFKSGMQEEIKKFYIRTALIAKGKHKFTDLDRKDLQKFLGKIYGYLDKFVVALGNYKDLASDQGVISRASSYGVGWGVFSRYSIPAQLADMLPSLPGVSCLGNGDCGCILEYDSDSDGYNVYWIPNPFKEHCVVCADLAVEWSPYKISYEDIAGEWGDTVFDEDGEFVEF